MPQQHAIPNVLEALVLTFLAASQHLQQLQGVLAVGLAMCCLHVSINQLLVFLNQKHIQHSEYICLQSKKSQNNKCTFSTTLKKIVKILQEH